MLNVRDLHLSFSISRKKLHAVRGISFDLAPNEILGIVGESGCGKSALAKALMQLHTKHNSIATGEVIYQEKNLLHLKEKELRSIRGKEIGMIFQDPMTSLNPTLKIGTQIIEGYMRHCPEASYKEAAGYALKLLEMVGIPDPHRRMEEYPHTLSGGTRQRAMIALALAPQPSVLIADEPTTALDVTIQAQILDLIKKIQKEKNMSILLITHDLGVVASVCDRVLVMYAGEIIESASVFDLFAHPRHPYTKKLLAAAARLDYPKKQPLIALEGSPPNLFIQEQGCAFYPRCSKASLTCREKKPFLTEAASHHFIACHHD